MTALTALLALPPRPADAQQQAPTHCWLTVYSQTGNFNYVSLSSQQKINTPGSQLPTTNVSGNWPALPAAIPAGQTENAANGGYDTGGMNAQNSGTVTATLTWVPAAGQTLQTDPPPEPVYLQETASAGWGDYYPGTGTPTGWSVSDGLGDPTVAEGASGASAGGVHLIQCDGSSGTITVSCSLSATGPTSTWQPYPPYPTYGDWTWPGCSVNTYFSVAVSSFNATIIPTGAVQDSNKNWNILIGQYCQPVLNVPSGYTIAPEAYQWSVTGPTFNGWAVVDDQGDQSHTIEDDGPGPLNIPSPYFFWVEKGSSIGGNTFTETISCTAVVQPPQGNPFTVNASQPVTVWVPYWICTGTGGVMNVLKQGSDYNLLAMQTQKGEDGGMDFRATVLSPNTALFGNGSGELVQLITYGVGYVLGPNPWHWSLNGQEGLDGAYPYPWKNDPPAGNTSQYYSRDSPFLTITNYSSAYITNQYEDWLMFQPPNGGPFVPLSHFVWSTDGQATRPSSNGVSSWVYWSGTAGPVTPSGSAVPFEALNSFPSWTQNNTTSSGYWVLGP